MIQFEMKMDQM